jgi:hypothetical protein
MASETFEQVLLAAQAEGSFAPAWRKFVKTRFYVAIVLASGNDRKNFTLHVEDADGKRAVTISELRDRVAARPGNALVTMSGAEVVRRLQAEADILVALSDRAFNIAGERVDWLKKGIEAAQTRAAQRASLAAVPAQVAPAAPAPVPAAPTPTPTAAAPTPVLAAPAPAAPAQVVGAIAAALPGASSHAEMAPPVSSVTNAPRAAPVHSALLSLATLGRLGRGHAMAYLLPLCIGAALFGVLAATLLPANRPTYVGAVSTPIVSQPFTAADGSFSVSLPGTPEQVALAPEMASQLSGIALHQYRLLAQDDLYMVQSIDYGERMPDTSIDAMGQMQAAVVGKDGRLLESKPVQLKGTTGRQVKVALPGGGVRAARFAILGSKFFMVSISAPDASRANPAIDTFLDSFKLN